MERVNSAIVDYKSILESDEITYDMKMYCYEKIKSKIKYKELIEETLRKLTNI
ncbi:hypothetical protein [Proteiniborus sp. MB09-C3]|uniref:hypothetical protein n=1 Tax=Proteiniborus sp. MB09-C3 TaxID=3050072 RepID=UPI00255324D2|nr:hypothetical protein [Proteiniborus sp. MB09-C3]WIV11363.1 hypothetical protein QO263_14760 [Proteiniborus sp. MB09-C3]